MPPNHPTTDDLVALTPDEFIPVPIAQNTEPLYIEVPNSAGAFRRWSGPTGRRAGEFSYRIYRLKPADCSSMRLVIVESPYAGDVEANIEYARACVRDSLARGEAPIASHLLYTQPGILNDDVPEERLLGINAGLAWRRVAEASIVYNDFGITKGMEYGIAAARAAGKPVEFRSLKTFARSSTNLCPTHA